MCAIVFHCKADASYFGGTSTLSLWESTAAGPQSRRSEEEVTHIWISAGQSCPATAGVTWRGRTLARLESVPFACVMKMYSVCVFDIFWFFFFFLGGGGVTDD